MRSFLASLILLLGATSWAAWAAPEPEYRMQVEGNIEIGADGAVLAHTLDANVKPAVRSLIERNIANWQFEPIIENGKPVIASTRMQLNLAAVPDGEDTLKLRLDNVWFGAPTMVGKKATPSYPRRAVEQQVGARVMLALQLDEQGKVVAAHPYQTSLTKQGTSREEAKLRKMFEQASIRAAMQWQYTPGEMIGGKPIESSVLVPIEFQTSAQAAQWRAFLPGPIVPAPWADANMLANVDTGNLADGQSAPIGSRFALRTPVEGRIL